MVNRGFQLPRRWYPRDACGADGARTPIIRLLHIYTRAVIPNRKTALRATMFIYGEAQCE